MFDFPYQGSEKLDPPLYSKKMKLIIEDRLIALMKRFDALIATQKSSALSKVPFLKKSERTEKK